MARVAFLLPREDMIDCVPAFAEQYHLDVCVLRAIHTVEALTAARQAVEAGADIIVCRGLQAEIIKAGTSVPMVTIKFTAQEMGLLIRQAKAVSGVPAPAVALVGYANMFQDVSRMGELLNVRFATYFLDQGDSESLETAAQSALNDGADVLIGGDVVCQYAAQHGIPSVYLSSGQECMETACRDAQRLAYALDLEKRNNAELQSILDYTVNGLILVDHQGAIRQINPSAEQLFDPYQHGLIGKSLWDAVPFLTAEKMDPVLNQGSELPAVSLRHGDVQLVASVSPVISGENITGAVISVADAQQLRFYTNRERMELLHQGYAAPFTFDTMIVRSPQMQAVIERAKRCAAFQAPVLILGEYGTERRELAQCIHNAGANAENVLIQFRCDCVDPKTAEEQLFSPGGLIEQAQGSIFLDQVSCLSLYAQNKLQRLLSGHPMPSDGIQTLPRLRVIVGDRQDLRQLVERGEFSRDLYYGLNITVISIPPLRQRQEDITALADFFLRSFQKRHGRYVHLTKAAWQRLRDYAWPGNLAELSSVCQRVVITSPRHTVDEFFLDNFLPRPEPAPDAPAASDSYVDPDAARISELLISCHGNRATVAQALGISTTTLWRRMKKFGIRDKHQI